MDEIVKKIYEEDQRSDRYSNNNNNNNISDNVYSAVIVAEPLREFTRFVQRIQHGTRWPPTFGPTELTGMSHRHRPASSQ